MQDSAARMTYSEFDDLGGFIAEIRRLGATTVILAWQDEYGQLPDPTAVNYDRVRVITLLAYRDGIIVRCGLTGGRDERARVHAELESAGLVVEERSRNIIGFTRHPPFTRPGSADFPIGSGKDETAG